MSFCRENQLKAQKGHLVFWPLCRFFSTLRRKHVSEEKYSLPWPENIQHRGKDQMLPVWSLTGLDWCRHSSVDSSTPSILLPRVQVPSTFIVYFWSFQIFTRIYVKKCPSTIRYLLDVSLLPYPLDQGSHPKYKIFLHYLFEPNGLTI